MAKTLHSPPTVSNPLDHDLQSSWVALVHPGSGSAQEHFSPLNHSLIAAIPASTPKDVAAAFHTARKAAALWSQTPLSARTRIIMTFHDLVLDHQADLLDAVQWETGKSRQSAFDEVADIAMTARYYSHSARRHLRARKRQGGLPLLTSTEERYVPKGVIGMITPWNYPLTLPLSDAIPALLAGNAVVLKPDAQTPLSALGAINLLIEAGLPRDLFQIVVGDGATVGGAIIDNADFVMFTGSTATGRIIAEKCGKRLIGFSAELGGKNPMIVLDDAPLERAVEGAIAASFSNAGQLCMSIERLYVHTNIYDRFVPQFIAAIEARRLDLTLDFSADMGSLISAAQLEKVSGHIDDAVAHGARVLTGGAARPDIGPYVIEPTVIDSVSEEMMLCRNETFGPVVALYRFSTDDEAVALANDTDYGLNASVWGSTRRAKALARRIEAGSVNVNEGFTASWTSTDAPMGGFKQSGVGRRHGREGIVKYTNIQTVAHQRLINIQAPRSMSGQAFAKTLTAGLRLMKFLPFRD